GCSSPADGWSLRIRCWWIGRTPRWKCSRGRSWISADLCAGWKSIGSGSNTGELAESRQRRALSRRCPRFRPRGLFRVRPVQVLVQELERALPIDRVRPVEPLDLRAIGRAELCIAAQDLGEF